MGGLTGYVAWGKGELVGFPHSHCGGFEHVHADYCSPLCPIRRDNTRLWGRPLRQRQPWATCWHCRINAMFTWQFPFISATCSPLDPILRTPSSWTICWIIKFTSNKTLGRGIFQARRSRPQLLFQMSPDSEGS